MTKTLTASWLLSAILGLTLALSGCGKTKPAPGKGEEAGHPAESGEETHAAEIPKGSQVVVCLSGRGDKDLGIIEAYEKQQGGLA